MIHSNLATRPFYNERAVQLMLLGVAALAIAASAFNATRLIQLSRRDTNLALQSARDEAVAADLRAQAARLRAAVDPRALDAAAAEARQANALIDRRTFSWTELLNRIEATLPDDVRITALRPKLDQKRGMVVAITAVAENASVDSVNRFIDRLEETGAFRELQKLTEVVTEQNQLEAALEGIYTPPASASEGSDR